MPTTTQEMENDWNAKNTIILMSKQSSNDTAIIKSLIIIKKIKTLQRGTNICRRNSRNMEKHRLCFQFK